MEARRGRCLILGWVMLRDMSAISFWQLTHSIADKPSSSVLGLLHRVFFPPSACWWLVSVFVGHLRFLWHCLRNPASGMLSPVPAAAVWPGSIVQGELCPLRWLVGNELQLLLSSIPDASPLRRHCAVFGTQLCFVNTEWRTEKRESQKSELLSWFQSDPPKGRGEGDNLSVGKFSGCSLSCLCSVERVVWVSWIQLHVWDGIIHLFRGRRKESLLFKGKVMRSQWFQRCKAMAFWQHFPEKHHTNLHLIVNTKTGKHWKELRASLYLNCANHLVWPRIQAVILMTREASLPRAFTACWKDGLWVLRMLGIIQSQNLGLPESWVEWKFTFLKALSRLANDGVPCTYVCA